jgi:outer membrane protein TolC
MKTHASAPIPFGLVLWLMAAHAAAQPIDVTLDDAIARALELQPSMVEAEGSRRVAAAFDRAAWGAFLPSISTSASAFRSNVERIDPDTGQPVSPEFTYTLGWSASLPLFEGFARIAGKRVASANVDAAEAGLRGERFIVILDTKQVFYAAAATDELVRVATAQVARAREQLTAASDMLKAGSATTSDSLRATVELGSAQIALIRAEAAQAAAQAALARQIGAGGLARPVPDHTLPALPDTSVIRDLALAESPSILQSEASARAADARVTIARSRYWPSLGMSYGSNSQGTGSPLSNFDDYQSSSSWRFSLAWPIFDGFEREAAQVEAGANREVAAAVAADTRRQVDAEVVRQVALLDAAYRQIAIAAVTVEAATEDFRVLSERYRLGVATSVDLVTSQENLTGAEVDLIQARFDYLIARAELEALVGRELE